MSHCVKRAHTIQLTLSPSLVPSVHCDSGCEPAVSVNPWSVDVADRCYQSPSCRVVARTRGELVWPIRRVVFGRHSACMLLDLSGEIVVVILCNTKCLFLYVSIKDWQTGERST